MLHFFLGLHSNVTKRYSILFTGSEGQSEEGIDEGDRRGNKGPSIQQHYGWFYILRGLEVTKLLGITGKQNVFEININFLFTWMSMEMEIQKEQIAEQRRQEALARNKR